MKLRREEHRHPPARDAGQAWRTVEAGERLFVVGGRLAGDFAVMATVHTGPMVHHVFLDVRTVTTIYTPADGCTRHRSPSIAVDDVAVSTSFPDHLTTPTPAKGAASAA
ncbi:hypothetical protein AB1Y20_001223 [Prymnesium parvum]|uniref:Uncharacterized protein n=1 Tax=Prymnesium parvum TaxID=97485 RepID=A0AB34K765_PRYPA